MGRDGRLKEIPAQQKKYNVVLRYLLAEFQPGERYSEKQVNAIIKRFHDDTATLRRGLVDLGWLKREAASTGGRSERPDGSRKICRVRTAHPCEELLEIRRYCNAQKSATTFARVRS